MFSGRRSARSVTGLAVDAGAPAGALFVASASVTTGVEVFSGKIRNPRGQQSQAIFAIFPEESPSRTSSNIANCSRGRCWGIDRYVGAMLIESRLSTTLFNIEPAKPAA